MRQLLRARSESVDQDRAARRNSEDSMQKDLHRFAILVGESAISSEMQKRVREMIKTFLERARVKLEAETGGDPGTNSRHPGMKISSSLLHKGPPRFERAFQWTTSVVPLSSWARSSVDGTSWEGWQAESRTPPIIDPERAPAEVHLLQLRFSYGDSAGARWESVGRGVQLSACHPSQLVRPTEASLPPFPACSTHDDVLVTIPQLIHPLRQRALAIVLDITKGFRAKTVHARACVGFSSSVAD